MVMRKILRFETAPVYAEFCDGCTLELNFEEGTEESVKVEFGFGYFSPKDGQRGTFVFCQSCAEVLYQQLQLQSLHQIVQAAVP